MSNTIVSLPSEDELESKSGWRNLGKNLYYAQRRIVLVVKTRLDKAVNGASLCPVTYPAGAKYIFTTKNAVVSTQTESVQRTAELTISNKLSAEFLSQQTTGTGASATGPSLSFSQATSQKISSELATEAKNALSVTNTFEIQNSEEIGNSIELQDGAATSDDKTIDVTLYLKLYEWHLDFYLVRLDQLTLRYKSRWFGLGLLNPIRSKISSNSDSRSLPLFRFRYYEPIRQLSVAKGTYHPDVGLDDSKSVHVEALTGPAPAYSLRSVPDLEKLASIAFPKTDEERRIATSKAAPKKKAKKAFAGARRITASRKAAKGTVGKSAAARKRKKTVRRAHARRRRR